jgi:NADH:ubiquinone oxidoreductase subunit 6 (subunit J)
MKSPDLIVPKEKQRHKEPKRRNGLSGNMTIVLIFITHGFVNSLLLGPWNPIRCAYWNRLSCTDDEGWVLNWLAFGIFHVCVLLSSLGYAAHGKVLLEQRLVYLCASIIISSLSAGIVMIDQLNKPMAVVQVIIYFGLLSVITFTTATSPPTTLLPTELRSSSFDARRKLPISSAALSCLFILSTIRLLDMTFGSGQDSYMGDMSSKLYGTISSAATCQMMWSTLILGFGIFLASIEQQKSILVGQVIALFISQCMLEGEQGGKIEASQLQAGGIATFSAILLGLLGIL